MKQRRLTNYERQVIETSLLAGKSAREIAGTIGRDHTVVSREIKRNKGQLFPYSSIIAQKAADRKAKHTNTRKLNKDWQLNWYVTRRLEKKWSPEQIAGRMRVENHDRYVCAESIYQYSEFNF